MEAAKSEIVSKIESAPKETCRHRYDLHYKVNAPKGDPEGVLRGVNIYGIHENMERDAQVNAAFASLRQTLEEGKPAPRIESPYVKKDGFLPDEDWEMFSSEVFTKYLYDELDEVDFKYWEQNRALEFYDPNSKFHNGKCGGIIDDVKELQGKLKAFDMPQHASLEPITVKTTSRCRQIKMWFAGNRCMRIQCEMGSKAHFRNGWPTTVVWSCIQKTKERQEGEAEEWRVKWAKQEEEAKAKEAKQRQEQKEKEQEEYRKQMKDLEENAKRREALRRKHENGEINSSELEEEEDDEEEDEDSEDEELRENDCSSAPAESPLSSVGEQDWTETEEEDKNGN